MVLPASLLRARRGALLATTALVASLTVAGPAAVPALAGVADDDPLTVTIDSVSPAVIPRRGPILITGTVTNTSTEQYRVVKVYALTSTTPFTTSAGLADATATDPATPFGERITAPDAFVTASEELDPGRSASFALTVPRSQLDVSGEPGVYWLGVHALGETDAGRDTNADGRDRVLVPLFHGNRRTIDAALVLSLRHQVSYDADGRLDDPDVWQGELAPGGRLAALADLATVAGQRRLSWLVDPAVADAVARIADGNPARSLADTIAHEGAAEPSASPSDGDSGEEAPEGADARAATAPDRTAAAWLRRTTTALSGDDVLALPYGDLDVAAAAEHDRGLYRLARKRSGRTIGTLELAATPVVAPPSGLLDEQALDLLPARTTLLVSDRMLRDPVGAPAVVRGAGHKLVVADSAVLAGSGGGDPSPLSLRQRILAEALVRLLDGAGPLVVSLPDDWDPRLDPASASSFLGGFDDAPWLTLTGLSTLAQRPATAVSADRLRFPERQQGEELDAATLQSARGLIHSGRLLDGVLPYNDVVGAAVEAEALSTTSYAVRTDPTAARRRADAADLWVRQRLADITVEVPPSVTLASDTGTLSADVVNGLDQTVRVRVEARSDDRLQIDPTPLQELEPGERATVNLEARATGLAVHSVQLVVTDERGQPVGASAAFPLRAGQVSQVIWLVFGVGALLLFTTIGIRLFRRVRRHVASRRQPPAAEEAAR